MKRFLLVLTLLCFSIGSAYSQGKKVRRIDLPEGDLKWSYERPKDAKFCVPAAFTDSIGNKIVGQYRYKGEIHQKKNKKMVIVSLKGNMFYISDNWLSDNGFQQWPLVYDSRTIKFKDPKKKIRRALCKDKNGVVFLLQSNIPMTLSDFAVECSKCSTNATYLDMGEYGYGYIKKKNNIVIPLLGLFYGKRNKQTNWLYIE